MSQARGSLPILGLPGKRWLSVSAVPEENGDSTPKVTQRFPELLELYARYHYVEGSTPATIKFYRKEVGLFIKFLESQGHSLSLSDVSRNDVVDHLAGLRDAGRTARTLLTRRQAILTFFNWARDWQYTAFNPVDGIKPPKVPKRPKPFLKRESFFKLLDLCPLDTFLGARWQSILWLLLASGIRLNELAHLNSDDLDWERGQVRVIFGKGQKQRMVPFPKDAQRPMLRYLAHRIDAYACLWVTEERLPMMYYGIAQDTRRLMERAGIKGEIKDVMHIFRRTFGANAVEAGVPREFVQSRGGWADDRMLSHYVAALQEEHGKAIKSFEDIDPLGHWLGTA